MCVCAYLRDTPFIYINVHTTHGRGARMYTTLWALGDDDGENRNVPGRPEEGDE